MVERSRTADRGPEVAAATGSPAQIRRPGGRTKSHGRSRAGGRSRYRQPGADPEARWSNEVARAIEGRRSQPLQTRYQLVEKVGDLAGAGDEHVEVAAGRVDHGFPGLELDLVQGASARAVRPSGVGPAGRSRTRRFSVAVRGAACGMHPPHPRDVLAATARSRGRRGRAPTPSPGGCGGSGTGMSSEAIASRVRQLIGMPSITWVPEVVTTRPGTCSRRIAPAMTERAALPVHSVTT